MSGFDKTASIYQNFAFIFDMDGTIVDSMPFHERSWLLAFEEVGINISPEDLQQKNRGTRFEVAARIAGDVLSTEDIRRLGSRKEVIYREMFQPQLWTVPGFRTFLQQVRALGIRTALATNAGKQNIEYILTGINMVNGFDLILGADHVSRGKPDPEIYQLTTKALDIPAEKCIVFEDSPSGIQAAAAAGMKVVVIETSRSSQVPENHPAVLRSYPDFTALNPEEILSVIQE